MLVCYRDFAFLFAALPLLLPAACRADDWPQWRGPDRDGRWNETGILTKIPAGGLKIKWRMPIGPGWSSPVIAKGRVYVTDSLQQKPKASERIQCLDAATGKVIWTYAYEVNYPDWAFTPDQQGGPTATPIVEAGNIYSLGSCGYVVCLDAMTGQRNWDTHLEQKHKIEVLQCRASPLIEGDLLILAPGGKPGACLIALDKKTGKEVWTALDEGVSNSSPIIVTAGGARQLIAWTADSLSALDPTTGKTQWRERMVTSNNDGNSTPIVQNDRMLVGGLMLKFSANKPVAAILWPQSKAASQRILSNTSTAIIEGGYVYSARSSGELVCLDMNTGKQIWTTSKVTDLKGGASIHITPQGDAAFLYTEKGELIRAKLSPQGYTEWGRAKLLDPVYPFGGRKVAWSPPSYANRHIFARSEKELICASLEAAN